MKNYIFAFIIVLTINTCFSQKLINDSIGLNELVVTGSKTRISHKLVPLSVSQVNRQDLENSGQTNILPALNYFSPGIFVTQRNISGFGVSTGGAGSISMRGISSSPNTEVLVMIDGHPQYQGIFGHPLADSYLSSEVEKVEIIRGPASILYGSNAMAGAINIITKQQKEDGLKVNANAQYGSYNTQGYGGSIGYKKDKFSIFAAANHNQTDGSRPNTPFAITNGFTKLGYEISKNFTATVDYSLVQYSAKDTVYSPPSRLGINILRSNYALAIENKYDKTDGAFKIYKNSGDHTLSDGFHSNDFISGAMLYQTLKIFKGNTITAGAEIKQYGGSANTGFKKDSLINIEEWAGYAYVQQSLFEKLTISGGIRLENNSKYGTELLPMGGLTYNLNSITTFKTSISKGFRSPTVMEMYLYAANPNLQPERMRNYEVSWLQSLGDNKLQLELTLYKVVGDNLIQVVGFGPTAKRQNVGHFNNQGVEFSAKYALNKNLFVHANYSYLDLGKAIMAAPRQQANISANYKYKVWNINLSTQYIERLYTSMTTIQPQYLLLNARISAHPLKLLEIFIAANNILNQTYEINKGYAMPGINFNAGINIKL